MLSGVRPFPVIDWNLQFNKSAIEIQGTLSGTLNGVRPYGNTMYYIP